MDQKETLEYEIANLKNASTYLCTALANLVDIDDFTLDRYTELDYIKQDIDDLIIKKEVKLVLMEGK